MSTSIEYSIKNLSSVKTLLYENQASMLDRYDNMVELF